MLRRYFTVTAEILIVNKGTVHNTLMTDNTCASRGRVWGESSDPLVASLVFQNVCACKVQKTAWSAVTEIASEVCSVHVMRTFNARICIYASGSMPGSSD